MLTRLCEIEIPAEAGLRRKDVTNERKIRQYLERRGRTLPGDIKIEARRAFTRDWVITIFENPDSGPEPTAVPVA